MNHYKLLELIQERYETIEVRMRPGYNQYIFLTGSFNDGEVIEAYGETFEEAVEMLASATIKEVLHATDD